MSPTVEIVTETQLERRREEILSHLSLSEEDLRTGAAHYTLTSEELAALDEIDRIDFLLGD